MRNQGKTNKALKELEVALKDPQMCQNFEAAIKRELESKKYEYKSELLKWDDIARDFLQMH